MRAIGTIELMTTTVTTAWNRADHLQRLKSHGRFDTLVIGGGIIGAGAALDLSIRGVDVGLVEQSDFAQGTSSRSTKLFHGGIRYLPHFEFNLVSEGLREQKILHHIADFLYDPLEFVIPIYEQYGLADAPKWASKGWIAPVALRAGLTLYDVLGGFGRPGDRHRGVDVETLLEMMPDLKTEGLKSGVVYSDAQTDDSRLVVTLLKTAVRRYGATAAGGIKVSMVHPHDGWFSVDAEDVSTGEAFTLEATTVIAATGAFQLPGIDGPAKPMRLVASKGTHLMVAEKDLPLGGRALVLPTTDDGRVLFIVPWLGHAMIGTTDTEYTDDPTHPTASDEDNEYLIRHVQRYLDVPDFEPISSFAGLRALADPEGESTAKASRGHVVGEPVPGLVQVAGGKLTTYRKIAAEAADVVSERLDVGVKSSTDEVALVGANGSIPALERRMREAGASGSVIGPSINRYGTEVMTLANLMEEDPDLAKPLGDGRTSRADVVYAVRFEAASRISDITLRRTHLAWFTRDHARDDVPEIASIMQRELGWNDEERARQLASHESELTAEAL